MNLKKKKRRKRSSNYLVKEAMKLLVERLPATEPELVYARSHLGAIVEGRACGCGDDGQATQAFADSLNAIVRANLPDELRDQVEVALSDDGVSVHVGRALTDDEATHLNHVVRHAVAKLQQGLGV